MICISRLLLTYVFKEFRNICIKYCGLYPCHYFGSPRINCDSMRKIMDIKLDLISDNDMYQFIEKNIRGGKSYITQSNSKANDK